MLFTFNACGLSMLQLLTVYLHLITGSWLPLVSIGTRHRPAILLIFCQSCRLPRGCPGQGFLYINWDEEMRDPESGNYARARNTNLNEDLGKVWRPRVLGLLHRCCQRCHTVGGVIAYDPISRPCWPCLIFLCLQLLALQQSADGLGRWTMCSAIKPAR